MMTTTTVEGGGGVGGEVVVVGGGPEDGVVEDCFEAIMLCKEEGCEGRCSDWWI